MPKKNSIKYKKLKEYEVPESDGSDGEVDNVPEKIPGDDGDDESGVLEQAKKGQFDYVHFNSVDSSESDEESADEYDQEDSSENSIGSDVEDSQVEEEWDDEEIRAVMDEEEEEMEESDD